MNSPSVNVLLFLSHVSLFKQVAFSADSAFSFIDNLHLLSSKRIEQLKAHSKSRESETKGNETLTNQVPGLSLYFITEL
jgi:hypothetical protein